MRELFIYYRVHTERCGDALAAMAAMQAQLCARHPHLVARLLQRDDAQAEFHTLMETYRTDPMHDTQGISAALQAEIDAAALALQVFVDGGRHTEVFLSCAS